ncbi:DUF883 C-terminal domain-containing protein [Bdellovibrio bacteriovorus]|uniref:DUF883 domain-containing protein n=1 Tax=Bdellovibrio bacteriovorus (strain ATCC 15356 / DSM 50701 / NCIMB 9529 / HD100) TaxID=264462 RepID=Q6MP78_BDEBA|nr:hypothetical protein [Bdellovibrio bacteriovorus]CAE78920.1 unnamed protein product [Bdellovibrio bacteriovorus HD100]
MDRDQLIAEIKKQLQEELKAQTDTIKNKIPGEQREQIKDMKDSLTQTMKENPWASVGIAALAGFVIARMLYKRKDD